MRKAILNLHSTKPTAPRFCDVIVEGESITLEVKQDKDKVETIPWDDLVYQVKVAKEMSTNKQMQEATASSPVNIRGTECRSYLL